MEIFFYFVCCFLCGIFFYFIFKKIFSRGNFFRVFFVYFTTSYDNISSSYYFLKRLSCYCLTKYKQLRLQSVQEVFQKNHYYCAIKLYFVSIQIYIQQKKHQVQEIFYFCFFFKFIIYIYSY